MDFTFFAIAIPAVLYAGIDKAGFGSSASIEAAAILALILQPAQAVAIMLPLLIVMDFVAVRPNWRKWNPPATRILIVGTTIGSLIGAVLIAWISPDIFRFAIGALALMFVLFQFARRSGCLRSGQPASDRAGLLFSVGAGITSFVAHAGGLIASMFLLSRGLGKTEYQATTIVVFWLNNLLKIALYIWLGFLGWQTAQATLYLARFAVLGTYLGVHLNRIVPEAVYFTLIYAFLTIAGAKLISDALF